jgi:hypothetical protein
LLHLGREFIALFLLMRPALAFNAAKAGRPTQPIPPALPSANQARTLRLFTGLTDYLGQLRFLVKNTF